MTSRADGKLLLFLSGDQGLRPTMVNSTDTCAVEITDQVAGKGASC